MSAMNINLPFMRAFFSLFQEEQIKDAYGECKYMSHKRKNSVYMLNIVNILTSPLLKHIYTQLGSCCYNNEEGILFHILLTGNLI